MTLNAWIRQVRIHTSCLTQAGLVIGLLLAGETNLLKYVLFMLFGVIFHAVGFTANNYFDYKYDRTDESKAHFPLVTGEISLLDTKRFIIAGTVLGTLLGIYLSNLRILSIAFLVGATSFGFLYNYSNKFMPYCGPLWITISFTCLPLFSYFSVTDAWSLSILFVTEYTLVLMFYQIAVEGNLKDINVNQANILIALGTKVENGVIRHSLSSKVFMAKLVALKFIIMFIFIWFTIDMWNIIQACIFSLLMVILLSESYELGKDQTYDNTTIVRNCALTEIFTYLLLATCLEFIMGWAWYVFLLVYPVAWFIVWNRITWGTTIRPRV
jgi:4-hydroxybenzoate polyprenyltransferase